MSVDQVSRTRHVYVRLRDEGTSAFRPVEAVWLDSATARLIAPPDYDADDEDWEFVPGSIVRIEIRILEGKEKNIAVALAEA
jgi:hypothetical protein